VVDATGTSKGTKYKHIKTIVASDSLEPICYFEIKLTNNMEHFF
jgi:hypothetical protein